MKLFINDGDGCDGDCEKDHGDGDSGGDENKLSKMTELKTKRLY
jgi:hypothetical protein